MQSYVLVNEINPGPIEHRPMRQIWYSCVRVHVCLFVYTQSNEVPSSNAMELEGLTRSLTFLKKSGVKVKYLVTDRHKQVQKYMREKRKRITHYYDVWHLAKGRMVWNMLFIDHL